MSFTHLVTMSYFAMIECIYRLMLCRYLRRMLKTECLSQYFFNNYHWGCHQYHFWVFGTTTVNIPVICVLIKDNQNWFSIDFLWCFVRTWLIWVLGFLFHLTQLKKVISLLNLNSNIRVSVIMTTRSDLCQFTYLFDKCRQG